jgi:CBS domain-containing protein
MTLAQPEAKSMGLLRLTHVRPEVESGTMVLEAVRVMAESNIGAIAVKNGKKVIGVFTERDLMKRVVAQGRDAATTPIKEVMTSDVVSVADSTPTGKAAAIMRSHRMRHLVIVDDNGDYLGMLAQRHILYDLMSELALKVNDLTGYLMADGPGG